MRKHEDKELIEYIFEFVKAIDEHIEYGGGEESFFEVKTVHEACLRELHKIAETTQRLSSDLKSDILEINWQDVSGMRNILVHEYLEGVIDKKLVWKTIKYDIPNLEKALKNYLENL